MYYPLFMINDIYTQRQFIVTDFVKAKDALLLVCRPYPTVKGRKHEFTDEEIIAHCLDPMIKKELLNAYECKFLCYYDVSSYERIARLMQVYDLDEDDLLVIGMAEKDIRKISKFLKKKE
jgi:hypothetical protein